MHDQTLHFRALVVTVGWTLVLLFLGSVVHATESSLACPDWPTCFGTMMPDMEGGVFWEHLHRLVAGGLILMFALATWLVRRELPHRTALFRACLAGIGLLLVQAVFGGLTVLMQLPDAVSTTHLGLALAFLVLAAALATATAPGEVAAGASSEARQRLRFWGVVTSAFVFAQSLLGGAVRHMDAGMACPDVPLCLGAWVPPLTEPLVTVHFLHRLLAMATAVVVLLGAWRILSVRPPGAVRAFAAVASALVVIQVLLGFLSVSTILAVLPVSLHTLVAAALLAATTVLAASGWSGSPEHAAPVHGPEASRLGGRPHA